MKRKYTSIAFITIPCLTLMNCNDNTKLPKEEIIITNERNIDTTEYQKSIGKEIDTQTVATTDINANKTPSERIDLTDKGIGPIKNITFQAIDQKLADKGQEIYKNMCTACHKPTKKFIGPAPKGILERRTPEWVMNMILNPEKMIMQNPLAKDLLIEFNSAPMANQNLTQEEARAVLEYFRTL